MLGKSECGAGIRSCAGWLTIVKLSNFSDSIHKHDFLDAFTGVGGEAMSDSKALLCLQRKVIKFWYAVGMRKFGL